MEKHFASPVEEIVFAGIEVCGGFEVVRRLHIFAVLLVDLAEQVVQLPRVFQLDQVVDDLARLVALAEQEIGHGQIVAVVVGAGIDLLGLFEVGLGFGNLSRLNVELAQVVVGVVARGLQRECLAELLAGQIGFAGMREARAQVGPCLGQIRALSGQRP